MTPSHYLEIEVEPGVGAPGPVLAQVFELLHRNFGGKYALGFPEMSVASKENLDRPRSSSPGSRLHVFGAEQTLAEVAGSPAFVRLRDYVHLSRVREVRASAAHCAWIRVRDAMSTPALRERKLRRALKRATARGEKIADDDARFKLRETTSDLPFINVRSASNGGRFTLFFDKTETDAPVAGEFDSYGFSKSGSTVPLIS